jgi:tetratricopeptide (TPR) repeat protein
MSTRSRNVVWPWRTILKSPSNPYIITPLTSEAGFYGRDDIFRFVHNVLASPYQNVIVLYGQRRIGKTSLLHQLTTPRYVPPGFQPVYLDLQGRAQQKLSEVLFGLAREIARSLGFPPPRREEFGDDGEHFQARFLPQVFERLDQRRLLLLVDEFDVIGEEPWTREAAVETLFPYLQDLIMDEHRLAFVFVVGRRIDELPSRIKATFKSAQFKRISLLAQDDAIQLITEQANDLLDYKPSAVERILSLTAGHPYFSQLICYELFDRCQRRGESRVSATDVDVALEGAMELGMGGLAWFWDEFPPAGRFILSAVAHVTDESGVASQEQIQEILQQHGVRLQGVELANAPDVLVEWEILQREGRESYRFVVEFLRQWIIRKHSMEGAKRELEMASPRAIYLYEAARRVHREGDLATAIEDYRRALAANPNHARAQLGLAQALYERGDLAEAITEFEKAYRLDEASVRDGLITARLALGRALEKEGRDEEAIAQYERLLALAPKDEEVQGRLLDIWRQRAETRLADGHFKEALAAYQRALALRPGDEELADKIAVVERRWQESEEVQLKRELVKRGMLEEQLEEEKTSRSLAERKIQQMTRYLTIALGAAAALLLLSLCSLLALVRLWLLRQ